MIVERYGLDALRYYLIRAVPYGNDGIFTPEDFVNRVNYDLANDLGNLLNRTVAMINKYRGGNVPELVSGVTAFDKSLEDAFEEALKGYAVHPAHVKVADEKVRPYTAVRSCLDFEV